ncbi:prepilin-type N-terminal cleavage/methylation domain-containing protein [Bacillus thuringiensis]|uniref:prepilin-type N-terminal cleavage/methylation domain-containing protein n=1 Tax=Bacillus thuringiensis TaxID=1428 RepID=UPI0021D64B92|nr:prepilin-type N-terminal cleavage/methylation domain-containing protein [Bacillus thuringiensis]MCU7668044.1 prepilin-type N-terminal cleavage/methylation domain-containing protein [Bacillus thuringiensis]
MLNKFKQLFKDQKGFTLVEILVVIVIIGILFVLLLPRLDFANDKARQSGVKTDIRSFQTAAEGYLKESAGQNLSQDGLNQYLDKALQIPTSTTPIGSPGVSVNSNGKDPWGTQYKVEILKAAPTTAQIIYYSYGKTGSGVDFIGATYYKQGTVDSCVARFGSTQDLALSSLSIASPRTGLTAANANPTVNGAANNCGGNI